MKGKLANLSPKDRQDAEEGKATLKRGLNVHVRPGLEEEEEMEAIEHAFSGLPRPIAAKILNHLTDGQLNVMRLMSRFFRDIIDEYQLRERRLSDGQVYAFGNGEHGTLGDGNDYYHSVSRPRRIKGFNDVTQVSCGENHTAFISNGQVYAFGNGVYGRLGDGNDYYHSVSRPSLIEGFNDVTQVSCGYSHTAFISNGQVYAFGNGTYGVLGDGNADSHSVSRPSRIEGFNNVTQVSCGQWHTAFISNGQVYVFGDGEHGKLGDGNADAHNVSWPSWVEGFNDVTQVSCGSSHTAFISNGQVYAFGDGKYGVLGDGNADSHSVSRPSRIEGFNDVTQVSCGSEHTAFISNGQIYTFGHGVYGRLGDGYDDFHSVSRPSRIEGFNDVTQVSCGLRHTAFISNGQVYAFGKGLFGKLGDGYNEQHYVTKPRLVDGFNKNVTQVSCGVSHTAFVTQLPQNLPVIASSIPSTTCISCKMLSLTMCDQCENVYCADCFDKDHRQ